MTTHANRRLLTAGATVAAVAAMARRRNRRRAAAVGIQDAILPTHGVDAPSEWAFEPEPGHAPGHRHVNRHEARADRADRASRGWPRRSHGKQHPNRRD
jgi:hypothetical protein